MQTHVFRVPGISCEHCRRAITGSVTKVAGVVSVDVDLAGKRVSVAYDPGRASVDALRRAIEDVGYDVEA